MKPKAEKGDTVISKVVLDWAGGRAQPDGKLSRDQRYEVEAKVGKRIDNFEASTTKGWKRRVLAALSKARTKKGRFRIAEADILQRSRCALFPGILVAGEELVADGSLPARAKSRDDRIVSYDMEGSGFAQACREAEIDWIVFRGISDLGDPRKKAKSDSIWQSTTAFMAGFAAREFLVNEFPI